MIRCHYSGGLASGRLDEKIGVSCPQRRGIYICATLRTPAATRAVKSGVTDGGGKDGQHQRWLRAIGSDPPRDSHLFQPTPLPRKAVRGSCMECESSWSRGDSVPSARTDSVLAEGEVEGLPEVRSAGGSAPDVDGGHRARTRRRHRRSRSPRQ